MTRRAAKADTPSSIWFAGYHKNDRPAGKFEERGVEGIFLGYGEGNNHWILEERVTGRVVLSHHPIFRDHIFPHKTEPLQSYNFLCPEDIFNSEVKPGSPMHIVNDHVSKELPSGVSD